MGRPRYPVTTCLLLAGGPLRRQECPEGGPDHTPWPTAYGDAWEYACQLLATGWVAHQCPTCRHWSVWVPDRPTCQPPMLPTPYCECGHHEAEHEDREGMCLAAEDDCECTCGEYVNAGEWPSPDDGDDDVRECAACGDLVQTLSSDDRCDGCVADGTPVQTGEIVLQPRPEYL